MAEFVTQGEGWWIAEIGDDEAYPVYVVRGPAPKGRGSRLCGVAGGGEALEQMLEARAVDAVRGVPIGRFLARSGGLRGVHQVPFAVDVVPASARSRRLGFMAIVSVEQVDGKPLAVTGMRQIRKGR